MERNIWRKFPTKSGQHIVGYERDTNKPIYTSHIGLDSFKEDAGAKKEMKRRTKLLTTHKR